MELVDTRDMVWVHGAIRGEFERLRANLPAFARGNDPAWERYRGHWELMHGFLLEHHTGEDALLWPLLRERLPDRIDLIDHMEEEHQVVHQLLEDLNEQIHALDELRHGNGDASNGDASNADLHNALAACDATFADFNAATIRHLEDEEQQLLPAIPGALTPQEWARLPQQATEILGEEASVKVLGYVLKWMPEADRPSMLATLPPEVIANWEATAADEFASYDASLEAIAP